MAYAFTYDADANFLVVKFWGEVRYREEIDALLDVLGRPQLAPNLRILVDRTEARLIATPEEVRSHVGLVEKATAKLGRPRVAAVVSANFDFGMLRMFEMVASPKIEHDFAVLRTLDEALEWLGIRLEEVDWPRRPPIPK